MADRASRLHFLVEGQTEETIVRDLFQPHFHDRGWVTSLSIVTTKRVAGGPSFRGGVSSWGKLEREIRLLLRDTSLDVLTTLIDYYGLPEDCPGVADRPAGTPAERVAHVEAALADAIADRRFKPHLVLHEFEAWVFAAADQFAEWRGEPSLGDKLKGDVAAAGGPELVNDHPDTAPSKRLVGYCPDYIKTFDGPLVVAELGLAGLRGQCPHLDAWLASLSA